MNGDDLEMRSSSEHSNGKESRSQFGDGEEAGNSLLWTEEYDTRTPRTNSYAKRIPSLRFHIWATAINILFFTASLMMWISPRQNNISLQDAWKATSFYSPVFDRFAIPTVTLTTNGTLFDTSPPSIWRARTGPAADAAWDHIGSRVPSIVLNSSEILAIGKDPATAVKFPPSYGFGDDAYIGTVEVFHHIHCLDKLRREISYGHYWEKDEGPAPGSEMHSAHTMHCIDVLLQSLKCTGSVDIVTFNWLEGREMMFPDFENQKVCRDFEGLRGWVNETGVVMDEDALKSLKPPEGVKRVKNPMDRTHAHMDHPH